MTSSDERVLVCEVSWIVTRDFETGDRVVVVAVTLRQGRGREGVDGFTPNVTELTSSESPCLCTISSNEHPSVSFSSLFRRRNKSFKLGISLTYIFFIPWLYHLSFWGLIILFTSFDHNPC